MVSVIFGWDSSNLSRVLVRRSRRELDSSRSLSGIEGLEDLLGRAAQLGAKLFIEIVGGFERLAQLIDGLVQ